METNSIRKRGFPIWEYSSLPAHFGTVITIWKRWSPYGKHSHMVIFTSIPKWAWTLFGNGLVTERSPFGNGDPFLYVDPHIEMGIRSICFPIWKRGFTLSIWGCFYLRFHMVITIWKRGAVSFSSLYGNGDSHMEMGIEQENYDFLSKIWGKILFNAWLGGRQKYAPHFHMGSPRTEMGRESRIFPYGESPFPNRVCFHLGINIYSQYQDNFRGCTGECFRAKAKKSFGSTYARKIEAKKTSQSTIRATPKIGDFHFRRWWPIFTCDNYFAMLASRPPGFSGVVAPGFCMCVPRG